MNNLETIKAAWMQELEAFNQSAVIQRVLSGNLTVEHYKSFLREIYFHTRENPQLQAYAATWFKGDQRKYVKQFYKHASSEIGHDQLALNDINTLGGDTSDIPNQRPLPETLALVSFGFYQVQFLNPIGYLGYLFHLEFTPTAHGEVYMQALANAGVPREAMTFIADHATIDVGHNKLMEGYAEHIIHSEEDLEDVIYAVRVTARLYARMVEAALERADRNAPDRFGIHTAEMSRRKGKK